MKNKRNLGVTETRLGLSLLTFLLVALGYVVLQQLGDAKPATPAAVASGQPLDTPMTTVAIQPNVSQGSQIVPAQGIEAVPVAYPQSSQRPLWLAPQQGDVNTSLQRFDPSAPDGNLGEPSLFDPETIRASQVPGSNPR